MQIACCLARTAKDSPEMNNLRLPMKFFLPTMVQKRVKFGRRTAKGIEKRCFEGKCITFVALFCDSVHRQVVSHPSTRASN